MIKNHCDLLRPHLRAGQQWSRTLFSLLCTERLRPCCWAFGKESGRDVSLFGLRCDEVFHYLLTGTRSSGLDSLINDFAATIHSSEEVGTVLATQAQYGMMALANTLELCQENDIGLAINSGIRVVDAIDNFELFAWESTPESGGFEEAQDYWLLSGELARQIKQAGQVIRIDRSEIIRLRIENRQYAIPPAVL